MTIYLVRHGLAASGVEDLDPGLTDLGHEQARAAASALQPLRVATIAVSPLRRTRETASPIASAFALDVSIRDEVAEVFDPSMPSAERRAMIGPFMAGAWSTQSAVLQAWRRRAVEAVLALGLEAASHDLDVVIVSHYIAICAAIGEATGDDRVIPAPIANCSITTLMAGHGGLELIEAGSTAHLTAAQVTGVTTAMLGSAPKD